MALHFWAAPGAARKVGKGARVGKTPDRLSIIVGGAIAVIAVVGVVLLVTGQLHF